MSTRPLLVLVVLLSILALVGGQRLLNSSFGQTWMPTKDYYPNSPIYAIDRLGERLDLLFSDAGEERFELCLQFAQEKFLETIRMVHIDEPGHAWIAAGLHEDYLIRGAHEIDAKPRPDAATQRARYVRALIERIEILAEVYPELPRKTRVFSLIPLVSTTLEHYDEQRLRMLDEEAAAFTESRKKLRRLVEQMRDADQRSVLRESSATAKTIQL